MSNITQVVNDEKNLTTLKKGMIASGLDQVLSGAGPFTVFAPSDMAFGKLDSGIVDELLKPESKIKLTRLLRQHVVVGKVKLKDFKEGDKLQTIDGKELLVHVAAGAITVGGSTLANREIASSNGVVYSLDTVLKN
ncbi:fasciclin domain-containing protein [Flavisolibacter sp. BT320]|nr:fasciclin domain-containing protein [Flavisolibacter longurius]